MDTTPISEQHVMRKMAWRLMPLLIVMFLIAFIDRQNVGFAKLEMVQALGMTEAAYGFGASLFLSDTCCSKFPVRLLFIASALVPGWRESWSPGESSPFCWRLRSLFRCSTSIVLRSVSLRRASIPASSTTLHNGFHRATGLACSDSSRSAVPWQICSGLWLAGFCSPSVGRGDSMAGSGFSLRPALRRSLLPSSP